MADDQATASEQPATDADYKALYEQLRAENEQVKAESRKWETRAKEQFEKAKLYDELQAQAQAQADANKTLEQQVADIRSQLDASNAANLRMRVATEKGIDAALLSGATEDELKASADALLKWREDTAPKPVAPIVPTDGKVPDNAGRQSQLGHFAHNFFGGN